jgi:hypothetical protein
MRSSRGFWKPVAVAVLIATLLFCLVTDIGGHSGHASPAYYLLPEAGTLDILPSGPGHFLAAAEIAAATSDPLLASLPPRGPPA